MILTKEEQRLLAKIMTERGKIGGRSKSKKKVAAARRNAIKARRVANAKKGKR